MDNQFKLAIGAAAIVGIGYYIYQINKPRILPFSGQYFSYSQKIGSDGSMTVTPKFANATGSCPVGATYTITPTLPTGLTINSTTGVITGTPTAILPRTVYTIKATNSGGSATATWALTVAAVPKPILGLYTPATVVTTKNGAAVNSTIVNSGATALFSISPALPSGITIEPNTGAIRGIATVTSPLTNYTITAVSGTVGTPTQSVTTKFTLTVNEAIPSGINYTETTVYVGGAVNSMPSCMSGGDTSLISADGTKMSADGCFDGDSFMNSYIMRTRNKSTDDFFSKGESLYL